MADKQRRPRRRGGKKADTSVTTGQQQQGNKKGGKNQKPQAKAQGKGKQGGKNQKPKAQPKQAQQQGGKGKGKQPAKKNPKKKQEKPQKQQRQQKNKQNANKPKKAQKQNKRKVSEEAQRAKRKAEEKHRKKLIIQSKFQTKSKKAPSPLEAGICEHLVQLGASNKDFKDDLRSLGIVAAREVVVAPGKKAVCVFVPFHQHTKWQKIQDRVSRELEKKYSGQDLIFVAQRKVMKLQQIKNNYPRPRNQTITSVHEQILDDIVYPTRIVGKRTRFRVGGKRVLKVYLDPKDSKDIEPKLVTYEAVYRKLTKKNVKFMFPRYTI